MSYAFFVLANGLALWSCASLARIVLPDEPFRVRLLTSLALFPIVVLLLLTGLGLTHQLSPAGALFAVAVFGTIVYLFPKRHPTAPTSPETSPRGEPQWHEVFDSLPGRSALVLVAVVVVPVLARTMLSGPHFSVDDLKYHAPIVTWWMQEGGFTDLYSYYYYAYYPFNAELFALWFVLPFGRDAYATLAGAYWVILLGTSLVVLLLSLERSLSQGLLLVALVLSMAIVSVSALRYAAVDFAGASAVIASLALIASGKPQNRLWLISGLLCGFAVGSKLIFVPAAAVILLWILLHPGPRRSLGARLKETLLYAGGLVATGSFWYLRNMWLTGNPIFPAQFGPLAGPVPAGHFSGSSLVGWLSERGFDTPALEALVLSHIDWPWPHYVAAVSGVLSCLALLLLRRVPRHERPLWVLTLLITVGSLVSFVFLPASGVDATATKAIEMKNRFLILPSALSLLCFALWMTRFPQQWYVYAGSVAVCVGVAWSGSLLIALAIVLASVGVLLSGRWISLLSTKLHGRRGISLPVIVLLAGLALWQPVAQRLTDSRLMASDETQEPAWKTLEEMPDGARIASVGEASRYIYPLFGRRLSLHPVVFGWYADERKPLYDLWRDDPDRIEWSDEGPAESLEHLLAHLREADIDYVYLSRTAEGNWPPHSAYLETLGKDQLIFTGKEVKIWRLSR